MKEYMLSVCFNYYKRFHILREIIESLIQSEDPRIQIVVYDDSSDSRMETFLSSLEDDRIKFVKSPSHVGMVRGMVECVGAGDGRYSMYATEMEMFDYKKLSLFIDDLERHHNVCAGYCTPSFCGEYKIYKKGIDAVRNVGIQFNHPTGYFFKTEEYKKIDYLKYSDTERFGNFPLDFLLGELLAEHDGMLYESVWYGTNDYAAVLSEETSFTTIGEEDAWFMLKGREKLLKDVILFVENLPLSEEEKKQILLWHFDECAYGVSVGQKRKLSIESACRHHHIACRYMDYKEYSSNLFHAYRFFCSNIPEKYRKGGLKRKALKIVKDYLIKEI